MARKKEIVIKPNAVAEARGKMSREFLTILDMALHQVAAGLANGDDPNKLEYEFYVRDYADKFGLNFSSDAYRKLRDAVNHVMGNGFHFTMPLVDGGIANFYPFQEIDYYDGEGRMRVTFGIRFKNVVVDYINERKARVYYPLVDTLQMASGYSKRLYPILLERVHKATGDDMTFSAAGSLHGKKFDRIDSMDGFRELLDIPKSYITKQVKDICETVIREIDAYTDYHAEVFYNDAPGGRGRYPKITHICWRMERKPKVVDAETESLRLSLKAYAATLKLRFGVGNESEDYCLTAWAKTAIARGLDVPGAKFRLTVLADKQERGKVKSVLRYGQDLMSKPDEDIKDLTDTIARSASDNDSEWLQEFERKIQEQPVDKKGLTDEEYEDWLLHK